MATSQKIPLMIFYVPTVTTMMRVGFLFLVLAIFVGVLAGGGGGCGSVVATDEGFVPDVQGTYSRISVTTTCTAEFDTTVQVSQAQGNVVIHGVNGVGDTNGTIDENGLLTLTGAYTNLEEYTCTGTAADDIISMQCASDGLGCAVSYQHQ